MPTHDELVRHAARWLKRDHPVVVTELVSGSGEVPDAIGFRPGVTTLIECKAFRSDFFADRKKPYRRSGWQFSMGDYRYLFCPDGLIGEGEVYEGWGLLYFKNGKIRKKVKASIQDRQIQGIKSEQKFLISLIRRIAQNPINGVSIKAYTIKTKNSASAYIDSSESSNNI